MGIDARGVATVDRIVVQFGVSPDDQVRMIERGEADVTMYGYGFAASAAFRAARTRLEQAHEVYPTPDTALVYLWMRAISHPSGRTRSVRPSATRLTGRGSHR